MLVRNIWNVMIEMRGLRFLPVGTRCQHRFGISSVFGRPKSLTDSNRRADRNVLPNRQVRLRYAAVRSGAVFGCRW